ncbi:MAG: hypothetical protein RIR70_249 [Pseudomonadota bacterium]
MAQFGAEKIDGHKPKKLRATEKKSLADYLAIIQRKDLLEKYVSKDFDKLVALDGMVAAVARYQPLKSYPDENVTLRTTDAHWTEGKNGTPDHFTFTEEVCEFKHEERDYMLFARVHQDDTQDSVPKLDRLIAADSTGKIYDVKVIEGKSPPRGTTLENVKKEFGAAGSAIFEVGKEQKKQPPLSPTSVWKDPHKKDARTKLVPIAEEEHKTTLQNYYRNAGYDEALVALISAGSHRVCEHKFEDKEKAVAFLATLFSAEKQHATTAFSNAKTALAAFVEELGKEHLGKKTREVLSKAFSLFREALPMSQFDGVHLHRPGKSVELIAGSNPIHVVVRDLDGGGWHSRAMVPLNADA